MKKNICVFLAALSITTSLWAEADVSWNTFKGRHFLIYYKDASERFVDQVSDEAEEYYDKIADDLGFRRFDFWLWDNRAKIYIYDNVQEYLAATGQPGWSSGCAYIAQKTIFTFPYAAKFFDTILPHEMGHIIFREFVGFNNREIPIWLDEGVASYEEHFRFERNPYIKSARREGRFIPIGQLSQLDPRTMSDTKMVNLFYAESVSIVDYLIKKFGKDYFITFCQDLRDGKDLDRAISKNYPFGDIEELGEEWERQF